MSAGWWKRAKGWPGWIVLGVVVVALLAIGVSGSGERSVDERVDDIAKQLACPICDGESVYESRNSASEAIRVEIRAQVEAGERSDDEIISFFVQRNERVLLVPTTGGIDVVVWALPVAVAVCAVAGLVLAFRRWRKAGEVVPTDADRKLVAAARRTADDEP